MKLLQHPSVRLFGVAVVVAVGLRAFFLLIAHWLWSFALPVTNAEILSWARAVMPNRDGAEPYGLLALAIVQAVATGLGCVILARTPPRGRVSIVVAMLAAVVIFAYVVPPRPPLYVVAPILREALLVVAGSLILSLVIARSIRRSTGTPALLAALLVPICFIPTTFPSLLDIICVLAPALRLEHGISPKAIYLQYDLLPSLLVIGWHQLGGAYAHFNFVCAATYYALLIGLVAIGRRMFTRPQLVGPMLVALVAVRIYGSMVDASAYPQVTPLRLDLWPLLLAAALASGLRRWPVGLVVALLCFFSRSIGMLYLGAYALALAADFFARRQTAPAPQRPALEPDLRASLREIAPSLALIALSFVVGRLVFGAFTSDAVAIYRRLGIGMMRVDATSFYWWLLPLTGAVGALAFSTYRSLSPRRAQATILAAALLIANSIYFFGRSHEHNLINTSASFVFCLFLALDLAWPSATDDPGLLRGAFQLAPYVVVAVCAFSYSGRVVGKLDAQQGLLLSQRALGGQPPPNIDCNEVRGAAAGSEIFVLSKDDYWYYEECGYTPRGYVQPVYLNVLRVPLAAEMKAQLESGVKILVPRDPHDWCAKAWPDLVPDLQPLEKTDSTSFIAYRRSVHATAP